MKKILFFMFMYFSLQSNAQNQTEFYTNGNKRCEGEYLANSPSLNFVSASDGSTRIAPDKPKIGVWNYWYESGIKSAEETYANGKTAGIWKTWYPEGIKSSEINYVSGKATFWYKNGNKQSEGNILENKVFTGSWKGWQENGKLSYEGTYMNGKKEGDWKWYDESGKLISKQIYQNDVLIETQK